MQNHLTQHKHLKQQHTSTTHATSAYTAQALSTTAHVNNTCNISIHSISTDCNSISQQHKQHMHTRHQYLQQQHKSTTQAASAYTAPAPTATEQVNNTSSICIYGTSTYSNSTSQQYMEHLHTQHQHLGNSTHQQHMQHLNTQYRHRQQQNTSTTTIHVASASTAL